MTAVPQRDVDEDRCEDRCEELREPTGLRGRHDMESSTAVLMTQCWWIMPVRVKEVFKRLAHQTHSRSVVDQRRVPVGSDNQQLCPAIDRYIVKPLAALRPRRRLRATLALDVVRSELDVSLNLSPVRLHVTPAPGLWPHNSHGDGNLALIRGYLVA